MPPSERNHKVRRSYSLTEILQGDATHSAKEVPDLSESSHDIDATGTICDDKVISTDGENAIAYEEESPSVLVKEEADTSTDQTLLSSQTVSASEAPAADPATPDPDPTPPLTESPGIDADEDAEKCSQPTSTTVPVQLAFEPLEPTPEPDASPPPCTTHGTRPLTRTVSLWDVTGATTSAFSDSDVGRKGREIGVWANELPDAVRREMKAIARERAEFIKAIEGARARVPPCKWRVPVHIAPLPEPPVFPERTGPVLKRERAYFNVLTLDGKRPLQATSEPGCSKQRCEDKDASADDKKVAPSALSDKTGSVINAAAGSTQIASGTMWNSKKRMREDDEQADKEQAERAQPRPRVEARATLLQKIFRTKLFSFIVSVESSRAPSNGSAVDIDRSPAPTRCSDGEDGREQSGDAVTTRPSTPHHISVKRSTSEVDV
ncbi:hypothetical protein WOLCODRAFT_139582 [Wolfiporia cocos MD-104 SS10]|uniref:Uncharacterized protein n=1 Tax=Wolfiporia cocos (strain MD-104) TaxID=742152 RepID=A0A2H3IXV4_WOLCO|nr:hypothetical protein WOLCODRAFT_139582 [Wolfiporia cocos MD-104 SS10]